MNSLCKCPAAGLCQRHGVVKTEREHELCSGENCTIQQSAKYWNAWENGRMPGQSGRPVESPQEFIPPKRNRGFGDTIAGFTKRLGIKPCGGCNNRAAWLNHHFPAALPPIAPVTLAAPVRHLMFHVWPVKGFGAWQWNCDWLLKNAALFNGRRIVSIVVDRESDSADAVRDYLKDFTDEFIILQNDPHLREVVTFAPMLERIEKYQSDQDVTLSCHGKCVRHKTSSENAGATIFKWTAAMYEMVTDWAACLTLLEAHAIAGGFRRYGAFQSHGWGVWHYSGAFFWFRNKDVFARNWRYVPQRFYGTEAWPGFMFRPDEAGVIACDEVGDLYQMAHWTEQIEPQLAAWRESRKK